MASKPSMLQIFSLFLICICPYYTSSFNVNYPAVFNFGDSNSDTGGLVAGVGNGLSPPNGQTYFNKPSGRPCDGRLIIDFLMGSMHLPYLNSYLDSIGAPSFKNGCDFAVAGSTIHPAVSSFSFVIQVAQFIRFKNRVLELQPKGTFDLRFKHMFAGREKSDKYVPDRDIFQKGLYTFDIGQNDLAGPFYSKTYDQVIAKIPPALAEFENGIQRLYEEGGARNFWIHNTGPLGCLAKNIAIFGTDPSKLDELGCVITHNQAAMLLNQQLYALIKKLKAQYTDANFTHVDIFSIKSDLIANYSLYGFEQNKMACCGYGGPPLNYDSRIVCGQTKVLNGTSVTLNYACNNSTKYVNWDGIHYTEAANLFVASQILSGKYSDPPFASRSNALST